MSASTSRSPACSRRAWWCTRPTARRTATGWRRPRSRSKAPATSAARRSSPPASRSRSAPSRRCRSRSATPSTPTTSSATYGADTARWFMLSDSPPERDVIWTERRRAGRLALRAAAVAAGRRGRRGRRRAAGRRPAMFGEPALAVRKAAHRALARVTEDIEKLHFNVCVAHIYEFANAFQTLARRPSRLRQRPTTAWAVREAADILVRLFHPMMPHLAEECWAALGHKTLVATEPWPQVEPDLLVEDTITLAGADQRQEARRSHGRPQRDECRDRGCRSGAGCGKTGARRQAAQKGHRRPAEDRQCGGMITAMTAAPCRRLAAAHGGRRPGGRLLPAALRRAVADWRPGAARSAERGRRRCRSRRRTAPPNRASRSRCATPCCST